MKKTDGHKQKQEKQAEQEQEQEQEDHVHVGTSTSNCSIKGERVYTERQREGERIIRVSRIGNYL